MTSESLLSHSDEIRHPRESIGALLALCGSPLIEPSRIVRVAGSDDWLIRAAVARNRGTPNNLVKKLASDAHPLVQALAAERSAALREASSKTYAVSAGPNLERIGQAIAERYVGRAGATLRKLRVRCAGNLGAPVSLLEALAKDDDPGVRRAVARNPNTPEVLRIALLGPEAKNRTSSPRKKVTATDRRSVKVLEARAKSFSERVRAEVAAHTRTPVAVLEALAKDPRTIVRRNVAGNPQTPAAVLEVLSKDTQRDVRVNVAGNPSTPSAVLAVLCAFADAPTAVLAGDPSPTVGADFNLRFLAEVASFPAETSNPALTTASRSPDWLVRVGVALHRDASEAMLEFLAEDADPDVAAAARLQLAARRAPAVKRTAGRASRA